MKVQYVIGADLSKRTIDLFCHSHLKIENGKNGFKDMMKWMKGQNINGCEVIIVMEHTGLYSYCFENFLHKHHIAFCKLNALTVKRSIGLTRGKSDKIDAKRLASYGSEKRETLSIEPAANKELQRLQMLYTTRGRMVRHKTALLNAVGEYKNIGLPVSNTIIATQTRVMKSFEKEIAKLQDEMNQVIEMNPSIKQNMQLLQSIKGVGKVVATAVIIKTKNFTRFPNARKFACFCGTAPFEYTSGTSIKGKTKVSHLADKNMKSLLNLSARAAIRHDKELREYYLRRTENGKSKMSALNIVRTKIIYRML